MKKWLVVAAVLAAYLPLFAHAQQWVMFVPQERDFRVLLPATPTRTLPRDGSVEYRVTAGPYQFFVFRHERRLLASSAAARADVFRRLASDEQQVRSIGDIDDDPGASEFMYRMGSLLSMHRVFVDATTYYELAVVSHQDDPVPLELVRDFFNSFQRGGVTGFPQFANLPGPETCQARANAFARRLCEYLSCQVPGHERHPACAGIPRFLR